MRTLDRRECIGTIVAGVSVLATGTPALAALAEEKQGAPSGEGDFWKTVDSIKARDLVETAINAGREGVASQRAINDAQRAAILLGPSADTEYRKKAETHYATRTAELQKTKQALARFVQNVGASGNTRFADFDRKGGLKEFTERARRSTVEALLHSDISPDEARAAAKALDERLHKVREMRSFEDATSYLDRHLDELIARAMPQEDPNGWCVLLLILSSLFVILLIIAVLICAFSGTKDCNALLNRLIEDTCPSR